VPSWTAASVIATVELATTTERDDARVTRAFERARQRVDANASLEPLPNQTKVRHTRLSVRAPSSTEAIAQATEITEAMQAAFSREGEGTLSADIRRRTIPVADSSAGVLGDALRIGAAVAGLLHVAMSDAPTSTADRGGAGAVPGAVVELHDMTARIAASTISARRSSITAGLIHHSLTPG